MINPAKNIIGSDTQKKLVRGLIIAGGLYLGYRVTSKAIKNRREKTTSALADKSPEVRQAMGLRSAMNPSGISWLMWSDGTNESAISQIASQIQNLDSVIVAYRNLYQDELMKDLQSELNTEDFNAFLQAVSNNRYNRQSGSSTPSSGAYTQVQRMIVAKQKVFVRTSPDASYHGAWYEFTEKKNIFKTANPGEFVGYATGKQHYDAKNNVKFIEVAYKVATTGVPTAYSSKKGQTKILWVSASSTYVDQFSSVQTMEAKYPLTRGVTKYLLPISGLGWLSLPGSRVITTGLGQVMDEQFKPIARVKANVLLGYPVMKMTGNGVDYTLVRTLEGQDRWIATDQTITN